MDVSRYYPSEKYIRYGVGQRGVSINDRNLAESEVIRMARKKYEVRTTTMTEEERKAAKGDATTQEQVIQNVADALVAKIIKERDEENAQ